MKKRFWQLFLILALLVAAFAVQAQAAEIPADAQWIEIGSEADFNYWFSGGSSCKLITDGYVKGMTRYIRLTEDVTVTTPGTYYLNAGNYEVNVYWDFNGKTLTYKTSDTTGAARFFGCYNQNATVTLVNGTVDNQSAITGSHGGVFTVNKGHMVLEDMVVRDMGTHAFTAMGKVFSVNAGNSLTLNNVDFYLNNTNAAKTGKGGAIRCLGTLTMTDCTFNSVATGSIDLGGILFLDGATVNMTRCSFTGGTAKSGGAIYANATALTATDCSFTDGKSSYAGNNIYLIQSDGQFENCTFTVTHSTATSFGGNFYSQGKTVTLKDSIITGGKASDGGAVYSTGTALTLDNTQVSGGSATREGGNVMQKNASLTLTNGTTVTGGKCTASGGNLSLSNITKFYMSDGITISGGSAKDGGNIYASLVEAAASGPVLNISGGLITGGTASNNGGNICLTGLKDKPVTLNLTGGVVGGTPAEGQECSGSAGVGGGNIIGAYATMNISGTALVSYGLAQDHGGNLYASTAATLNISGGTVANGTSKDKGGSIYISSTNSKVNISGGIIKDGFAYMTGGNIYHGNGKLTITGGIISGGRAESTGGNIQANMGYGNSAASSAKLTISDDGDPSTPLPQILDGSTLADGGNVYVAAAGNSLETGANTLVLGNCIISGGSARGVGQQLYIAAIADLQILPELTEDISVYIEDAMLPETVVGGPLNPDRATCTGAFTGKLILESHGNPFLFAKADDTQVYVTGAATVAEDGAKTWYKTNEEAVAAYGDAAWLQAGPGELTLTDGEYIVDLAGQNITVTGTGAATFFDSANDDFTGFGSAVISGVRVNNTALTSVGNKDYYMVTAEGVATFHRVEARLTNVALRPSMGGIYYTAKWSCDDTVKPLIQAFGVAVSMKNFPGADFAADETALWTTFQAADFESGVQKTGAMIAGILKEDSQERIAMNSAYAQMPIFAQAYVTIDGVTYTGQGAGYSMYDILQVVAGQINEYYAQAETLQSFMTHWSAKGLAAEPWDSLDFAVREEVLKLNGLYAQLQPYYGELHDHAATGGTSDGKQTLAVWKEEMEKLEMDFATIVDHRQSLHMYLEDWDNSIFIGGSEAAGTIKDRKGVYLHYNMIVSDPKGLEAVVSAFPEYNYREWTEEDRAGTGGQWHFDYPSFNAERFSQVCEAVYANGGFVSLVHPKADGYIDSTNPADAYFYDGTGIEVFYTYHSTRDGFITKRNYDLWTGMLKAGYKVYATAGNDEHNMPSDKAVSVIYSSERDAGAWVEQLRNGQFIAGGVGIRSAMGDTLMGGTTPFVDQQLIFSVGDFHKSLYDPTHTYRVDVMDQNGAVFSEEFSCTETAYFAMDADASANYYYIEVYDVTADSLIAIGNPIWNEK